MKLRTVLANRLVTFLAGLALAGAGAFALAWVWQVPLAREQLSRLDRPRVTDVPDQSWWTPALWSVFAGGLVLGIALLAVNLSRRRTSTVQLYDQVTDATLGVELGPVVDGVAAELAALPGVRAVRGRAVVERHLPTLSVVVHADPTIDVTELTEAAEDAAQRVARALGGAHVATQVLVHLDPAVDAH
ncbi:hypothetical protein [Rhodococcus pyridinivorans]|uniref:hypothetical protein n=1 Tax=Rhodococcus pyridinivorans TaxID=103816 RepID=UPI002078DB37|nr:hypothetical protein [Rhodococcus pyridinivorans]USI89255.1 hypothetical protein LLA01_16910 [Rhodococcus pyridinivorans]